MTSPWLVIVLVIVSRWRYNERYGVSNHRRLDCLLSRLFRRRSKKKSKLRVSGLCEGNSPVTGEFPTQRASNAENVSIWWRHHEHSRAIIGRRQYQRTSKHVTIRQLLCVNKFIIHICENHKIRLRLIVGHVVFAIYISFQVITFNLPVSVYVCTRHAEHSWKWFLWSCKCSTRSR